MAYQPGRAEAYQLQAQPCPGCGSTRTEREKLAHTSGGDPDLRNCPHCGSQKCICCDMGDDVECPSCPQD